MDPPGLSRPPPHRELQRPVLRPPYCEPIHPHGDPLIWREHSWYGAHIAYKLEEAEKAGAINVARYLGWGHLGFHWITIYHNIAGMLTESASAKLATPLYVHPDQLVGDGRGPIRGMPHYEAQTNFPNPWSGGWWHLRDIVEQQKVSAWALLDMAARNKTTVLRNAYQKARRQTRRGECDSLVACVIPRAQHDPLTSLKLVNKLLVQGIEVHEAAEDFKAGAVTYTAGSYVVFLAQPKMGVVKTLLGRTLYPDNPWTREADGSPSRPQDTATDTMAEYMGVLVDPVDCSIEGEFEKLEGFIESEGAVEGDSAHGYAFDGALNDGFKAVNLLLDRGVGIKRVDEAVEVGGCVLIPGDFIAEAESKGILEEVAKETGVVFTALGEEVVSGVHDLKRLRVGMYQRYWGGNMDEGWTRFVLEQFGFPYETLMDDEIRKGGLKQKYDAIILPDDPVALITGDGVEDYFRKRRPHWPVPVYPPEYRSGIGEEGVEALREFVKAGGTLVTLGAACDFAIEKLGLNVRTVPGDVSSKEFFCPGSTLNATFDNCNPLGYGMPRQGWVFFWNNKAFEVIPSAYNERYEVVAEYAKRDLLQSGWLIGEDRISKKAAMISAGYGDGRAVLIGFRTQHRAQTHGTYKLLFNALVG